MLSYEEIYNFIDEENRELNTEGRWTLPEIFTDIQFTFPMSDDEMSSTAIHVIRALLTLQVRDKIEDDERKIKSNGHEKKWRVSYV
jgi:hypothetical protein